MADNHKYYVGDKFVIEIGHAYWSPTVGNRYFIKGFDTLVFDDKGLERLEPYRAYKEPSCRDCVYSSLEGDVYPCSICYRGHPKDEMFTPKGSIISGKK